MRLPNIFICLLIILFVALSCTKADLAKSSGSGEYSSAITDKAGGSGSSGGNGGDSTKQDAGVLTAGEWNDFENWPWWLQLINNNDTLKNFQTRWEFYPNEKWMFNITDRDHLPIPDATVTVSASANEIWKGKTNRFGILQLVPSIFSANLPTNMHYSIAYNGHEYATGILNNNNRSISITLPTNNILASNVDLMFVVDATGSMGDEISYLKKELRNVLNRVDNQINGSIRYAGIFYRDFEDDYVTKINEFSSGNTSLVNFVAEQQADGGGDYPEALEEALKAAMSQKWSITARARILFLILDAPVHDEKEKINLLKEQVKTAAAKGIMVIPISASGTDKPAEFLFRFIAQATNGTYTFLTDHSGIGNSHIAPTVGHFEVEYLNNLIVRLITKYAGY